VIVIFNNIFRLQKRVIRIITNIRLRDSCREQFKKVQILPLQSQCMLSSLLFPISSSDMVEHNCEIHTANTRNRTNLHLPHLRQQFKSCLYSGIQVYNDHPSNIKRFIHDKRYLKLHKKKLSSDTFLIFIRGIFQF
jgi:hypothetical protein